MSFLIDNLLRDTHNRIKLSADTPAVVTTGFPKHCFPPASTLFSSIGCCSTVERDHRPCSSEYHGDLSSPSDSETESSSESAHSPSDRRDPLIVSRPSKSRPSFSASQVQTLESVFAYKHYVGKAERKQLAADLNMSDEQVKTWFQNKRTKLKKMTSQMNDHCTTLLYLNDIANGLPRDDHLGRHSLSGYYSYCNEHQVVPRTKVDNIMQYLKI